MLNMERSGIVLRRIVMLAFVAIFVVGCGASNTPATPVPIANTSADQDSSVLLTVAVPSFLNGNFSPSLISAFDSTHPEVKVSLVKVDAVIPPAAVGMDKQRGPGNITQGRGKQRKKLPNLCSYPAPARCDQCKLTACLHQRLWEMRDQS
jgi:hypothetical protein